MVQFSSVFKVLPLLVLVSGALAEPRADHKTPGRGSYFTPDQHERARDYFETPDHRGFVPPGLAKKGGLPPGQAKKWQIGQPLPRGVVFYELPRPLAIHLGPPPIGHRYVRVATDILLIAIGTGIVIDALEDLAR
jgi:Ni/Co efflux regulator RcnB